MDKISFKGLRNVGAMPYSNKPVDCLRMIVQLNDEGAQDLSEFKDVFEKFPDISHQNLLKIEQDWGVDEINNFYGKKIIINNKALTVKDENLSIFSRLYKLMTKIVETREQPPIDKEYTQKLVRMSIRGQVPTINEIKAINYFIDEIHDTDNVRQAAKSMQNSIDEIMQKYFAKI